MYFNCTISIFISFYSVFLFQRFLAEMLLLNPNWNCWFSHDVTKIQTKKLSLLLSFYFHVVLNIRAPLNQTNFRFKMVLCFAIQDAWISRFLHDTALSWQLGKLLCGSKTLSFMDSGRFCFLHCKQSLSQNTFLCKYNFNLYEFLKRKIHALVGKLKNRCFCWFLAAIFLPLKGTQAWHLHRKLFKFG